ncbi:MAG: cell wall-active antibiotics response protein LiaF [Anaerolineales bacterium]
MKLRGEILVGVLLVLVGFVALVSNLFNIDFGLICWPSFFILLGIWIIVRPRMVSEDTSVHLILLGDLHRSGKWEVSDQEIWAFIADADIDFTQVEIPDGETAVKMYGFVGDLDISLPVEVGFKVNSYGFVTDARILDEKKNAFFLQPLQETSENYATAAKKINIDLYAFVSEIKVRQA